MLNFYKNFKTAEYFRPLYQQDQKYVRLKLFISNRKSELKIQV